MINKVNKVIKKESFEETRQSNTKPTIAQNMFSDICLGKADKAIAKNSLKFEHPSPSAVERCHALLASILNRPCQTFTTTKSK